MCGKTFHLNQFMSCENNCKQCTRKTNKCEREKKIHKQMTTSSKVICWHKWVLNSNILHVIYYLFMSAYVQKIGKGRERGEKQTYCRTLSICLQNIFQTEYIKEWEFFEWTNFLFALHIVRLDWEKPAIRTEHVIVE